MTLIASLSLPRLLSDAWNGRTPLWRAVWLHGIVLWAVGLCLLYSGSRAEAWPDTALGSTRAGALWLLPCVVLVAWQAVVLRRAARRHGFQSAAPRTVLLVTLGLCAYIPLRLVGVFDAYQTFRMIEFSRVDDVGDDDAFVVAEEGRAIRFVGDIRVGFADDLRQAFADNPTAAALQITSLGGRLDEGLAAAAYLEARGDVTVEAADVCASACTAILLAGQRRIVDEDTDIGLHRGAFASDAPAWMRIMEQAPTKPADDALWQFYVAHGVHKPYADRIFARVGGDDLMHPSPTELFAQNFITTLITDDGREVDAAGWRHEVLERSLTGRLAPFREFFTALERAGSPALDAYAARMDRLRSRTAMVPVVESALQHAMTDGMTAADDAWVARWAESYGAMLAAAQADAPEACGYITLSQRLDPNVLDKVAALPAYRHWIATLAEAAVMPAAATDAAIKRDGFSRVLSQANAAAVAQVPDTNAAPGAACAHGLALLANLADAGPEARTGALRQMVLSARRDEP